MLTLIIILNAKIVNLVWLKKVVIFLILHVFLIEIIEYGLIPLHKVLKFKYLYDFVAIAYSLRINSVWYVYSCMHEAINYSRLYTENCRKMRNIPSVSEIKMNYLMLKHNVP